MTEPTPTPLPELDFVRDMGHTVLTVVVVALILALILLLVKGRR